jgi:hypothetical protein
VIGLVLFGGVALMWGLRAAARAIARRGDARVADEARRWLDRQEGR